MQTNLVSSFVFSQDVNDRSITNHHAMSDIPPPSLSNCKQQRKVRILGTYGYLYQFILDVVVKIDVSLMTAFIVLSKRSFSNCCRIATKWLLVDTVSNQLSAIQKFSTIFIGGLPFVIVYDNILIGRTLHDIGGSE